MKILIAIPGCRAHHELMVTQRQTWIKDIQGADHKFFVGDGEIFTDEVQLGQDEIRPENGPSYGQGVYTTLPEKTKLICQWAIGRDYDFMFKTDTDTVVNFKNLMLSGFEKYDYSGAHNHEATGEFCSGGAGYWLSRKAMSIVAHTQVKYFAEDVMVALALREQGILPVWNTGYRWQPGERFDKDMITLHVSSAFGTKIPELQMRVQYDFIRRIHSDNQ